MKWTFWTLWTVISYTRCGSVCFRISENASFVFMMYLTCLNLQLLFIVSPVRLQLNRNSQERNRTLRFACDSEALHKRLKWQTQTSVGKSVFKCNIKTQNINIYIYIAPFIDVTVFITHTHITIHTLLIYHVYKIYKKKWFYQ